MRLVKLFSAAVDNQLNFCLQLVGQIFLNMPGTEFDSNELNDVEYLLQIPL